MTSKQTHLYSVGQTYHDFCVTKAIEIPELQCVLRELVHEPTGALVMHIENQDPENLFCLSFRTLPMTSDGVAHILEHTVLCGSKKFPVKDPFFAMNRRSLNTFMNALTGSDFTCFPAATQLPKDFYNLLNVYLDAVFHPNLKELSFLQEGHRLEFTDPRNPNSPLQRKGIVFNEMKGALASANARLNEAMNAALFPNLTYGVNSGGDPKVIPQLTYEELRAFYARFYHPSRCLFFFYGNMPLEGHLDFIATHALDGVQPADALPPLPMQPRFKEPKKITLNYPITPDEDPAGKALISFGWLTCSILQQQEVLALSMLELILMDNDASPLKRALLKSGLCKQATITMDDESSEIPIVLTVRGCDASSADPLEAVLRQALEEIVRQGISLEVVERAMHQLEIYRSEITGNKTPFGLTLFMRSALLKQHHGAPEDGLVIHTLIEQLRRKHLEDPHYLTGLIRTYLLDNPHFVRITMVPDKELSTQEIEEEQLVLRKIQEALSPTQVQQILDKSAELIAFQKKQEEENLDVLPKISLDDVPYAARQFALTEETVGPLQLFHHNCFTNDIVYADLIFDLPALTEEELPLVRLLTLFLTQVGSGGRSYVDTLDYMQAHTGGVGSYLSMRMQATDSNLFVPSLILQGKALNRKAQKLFPLMLGITQTIDFNDLDRLKEVLLKHYTMLHSTFNQNALGYALNLSASGLDVASKVAQLWFGFDYYALIRKLVTEMESELKPLIAKLQALHQRLLTAEHPHLVLTCQASLYDELKQHHLYGLDAIATREHASWQGDYPLQPVTSQGRIIASPVAFTGRMFKTVSYTHPDAAALLVAASLFDNLVLHRDIREQGGAYGGGASSNPLAANFYFYAYRDPNLARTLVAFDRAIQHVATGHFNAADLEEAKLEVVQGLDTPVAPGSRGAVAYGWLREGKTPTVRQAFRNRLLSLTAQDVIAAVEQQIIPHYADSATIVMAGKELLEKENQLLQAQHINPLPIKTI